MNISYYKKWVEEVKNSITNNKVFTFKSLDLFEGIVILSFKENKMKFIVYDNILFFSDDNSILTDFQKTDVLGNMNNFLNHATLKNINLINDDKIIELHFTKWNIYNQVQDYFLIFELINKYQNIILCTNSHNSKEYNKEVNNLTNTMKNDNMIILDCKKKITFSENKTRQIIPGSVYLPPNTDFVHIEENIPYPLKICIQKNSLSDVKTKIFENTDSEQNVDYIEQLFFDMNSYFSFYFQHILFQKKIDLLKKKLINDLEMDFKKANIKLKKQNAELESANEIHYWSQCVELLKGALGSIKKGMKEIRLVNYFDSKIISPPFDGEQIFPEITIMLNPEFSPQKNLNFYLKKYKKALSGQIIIAENIKKTLQEIDILNIQMEKLMLEDSYQGLKLFQKESPLKWGKEASKKEKYFRVLKINNDWEINIGRSSKENDLLTCKSAKPDDWWFHTRIYHGTHIVLRNFQKKEPPEDLILLCCRLAAYYSKAKNSLNVPVDYTKIRYVRKPKGSPQGYVVYKNQKTIFVNPIDFREAASQIKGNNVT
ncbi:MAG: NFACT RNA binding domain-containing protein [Candidatus Cloacimonetes bacterium]|nr:NFACT RNA binding domain-containing protein [Candidatus Cloacimonadota bacterium]